MSCNITKGRIEECKDSVAGVQGIYFENYGFIKQTLLIVWIQFCESMIIILTIGAVLNNSGKEKYWAGGTDPENEPRKVILLSYTSETYNW